MKVFLALLAFGVFAIRRRLIMTTVDGPSMEPALSSGDRVLVRRTRRARRGQVALLRFPQLPSGAPVGDQLLLKRVVAVAGDRIPVDWADPDVHGLGGELVPPGCAVVLGDNRPTSWDSRHYGFVPRERIVGVVVRHVPRANDGS
ncbi:MULTISPECIES: S26 family signal peptidase [unclassified Amycolatopsis]|uniref:S26 family signal peptidase n=1 Tax=unclassified Amycolatopsis TaxID=2618356 RepID=UPI002874A14F|nr:MULTISPECIES: S26 family signal peptidase [unclassified Amycolatopsis]MDS0137513.1 S26 family signal peptidase [Amycolatopsis sp. 505]MDS0141708.1 S26 family signal peptidase [Amycolatopsis sp. CM201R]